MKYKDFEKLERMYTVREVMTITHRSKATIYAYIRAGLLKAQKLKDAPNSKLLIKESDLKAFIAEGVPTGYYEKLYPRSTKRAKDE